LWHCRLELLTSQVELGGPPPQVGAIAGPRPPRRPAPGVDAAIPNELIGPREHNWLTSKVLSTAVRAYSTGSVTLRTGHPTLIERVCAGQRGMVGAGGVEPPSSSVSARSREPLCGRPFPQVTLDRKARSKVLTSRSVKCLLRAAHFRSCRTQDPLPRALASHPNIAIYLHTCISRMLAHHLQPRLHHSPSVTLIAGSGPTWGRPGCPRRFRRGCCGAACRPP